MVDEEVNSKLFVLLHIVKGREFPSMNARRLTGSGTVQYDPSSDYIELQGSLLLSFRRTEYFKSKQRLRTGQLILNDDLDGFTFVSSL